MTFWDRENFPSKSIRIYSSSELGILLGPWDRPLVSFLASCNHTIKGAHVLPSRCYLGYLDELPCFFSFLSPPDFSFLHPYILPLYRHREISSRSPVTSKYICLPLVHMLHNIQVAFNLVSPQHFLKTAFFLGILISTWLGFFSSLFERGCSPSLGPSASYHWVPSTRLSSWWVLGPAMKGWANRLLQGGFLGLGGSLENWGRGLLTRNIQTCRIILSFCTVLPLIGGSGSLKSNFIFAYVSKEKLHVLTVWCSVWNCWFILS